MARVIKRTWTSRGPTGHRVKKVAYGYTLYMNGQRERVYDGGWTKEDAQNALAARVLERDTPTPPASPKTFAEVVTEYLDFKRAKGKRSVEGDVIALKRFAAFFGADLPITAVTAQGIARYDRERLTQTSRLGRSISPASVNRELACLRHLLRLAEEWGYVEKVPRVHMARETEGRLRFLDEPEAVRLLDACRLSRNPWLLAIVTVALNTGMRRGEIPGLTWKRVDFARGVLQLEQTKNGRRREVPMNRSVDAALSGLPGPKAEGTVFRRADGSAWGAIRTAFERACREAKLTDFRFHDLRHTAASWLIMRGRSLKEVQELLGHRTFTMTLRYAHLSPDRLRDAVASLDEVGSGTKRAQSDTIGAERRVSP